LRPCEGLLVVFLRDRGVRSDLPSRSLNHIHKNKTPQAVLHKTNQNLAAVFRRVREFWAVRFEIEIFDDKWDG